MAETSHETNVSPLSFIDKNTFDVGMSFCLPLGDIETGEQYRHTRKLPTRETALRAEFGGGEPHDLYAEDRIVMVVGKMGSYVLVADLYRSETDELVPGDTKPPLMLTPEGLVVPEGLITWEERAEDLWKNMAEVALGYFSETEGAQTVDAALSERLEKKVPKPLKALEAVPPTEAEQNRYYG
jgi:hypothetical protein